MLAVTAGGRASSVARTSGRRVESHQSGSHAAASSAVPTKAHRQEERVATAMASGGASIAPTDMPTKSIEVPRAWASSGRVRRTIWTPAGNEGDSATPRASRSASRTPNAGASAWSAATRDQRRMAAGRLRRAPSRSTSAPAKGAAARYAIENPALSQPYEASSMCSAFVTVGASTESVCRST